MLLLLAEGAVLPKGGCLVSCSGACEVELSACCEVDVACSHGRTAERAHGYAKALEETCCVARVDEGLHAVVIVDSYVWACEGIAVTTLDLIDKKKNIDSPKLKFFSGDLRWAGSHVHARISCFSMSAMLLP